MSKHSAELNETKVKILHAAALIVKREGATALTLESAAKEAGISKGGLLYNYPNKDTLIKCMNEYLLNQYLDNIQTRVAEAKDVNLSNGGKWTRAYIKESFETQAQDNDYSTVLLTLAALQNEDRTMYQEKQKYMQKCSESDKINPLMATILRLAADGLQFHEALGQSAINPEMREKLEKTMLDLTDEREAWQGSWRKSYLLPRYNI